MFRRPFYSVLLGLLLAAGAIYVVYSTRTADTQATAPSPPLTPLEDVLVAARDIPFGMRITDEMIKAVEWPADAVPANVILDRDDLLAGPEGARIAIRSFTAGEPFLKPKISGYGERPTMSRKVAEGMRAVSIRINDVSGVAGFLLPGDRVDVLLTRTPEGGGKLVTDVILQNISVLGIDQLASEQTENPVIGRTATLEVTPEQGQKLALAQQIGTLSLTLRNFTNSDDAEVTRISVDDLAGNRNKEQPAGAATYVRVRKGTEVKSERID